MSRILFPSLIVAAAATLSMPTPADAVFHSDGSNATGPCNGALPAFEGALRKRPLALRNEGTTSAFVSCSLQTDGGQNNGYGTALLTFVNRNATSTAVDCTMVNGTVAELVALGEDPPTFFPQTLGIPANSAGVMTWEAPDFQLTTFNRWLNFTCNLPPGVEIALIGGTYDAPDPP